MDQNKLIYIFSLISLLVSISLIVYVLYLGYPFPLNSDASSFLSRTKMLENHSMYEKTDVWYNGFYVLALYSPGYFLITHWISELLNMDIYVTTIVLMSVLLILSFFVIRNFFIKMELNRYYLLFSYLFIYLLKSIFHKICIYIWEIS